MAQDNHPLFVSSLTLAAVVTAVSCSRLFIRYTLKEIGLAHLIDDAELVVSELMTNAVEATGVTDPHPRWTELRDLALVRVTIVKLKTGLVVEVWDRDTTPPTVKQAAWDDESGRGLFIVTELCQRWNHYLPRGGGKVVWGELEIPPYDYTTHGLPKRPRVLRPSEPAEVMQDPKMLRRVIDGLKEL
jgi:anti-sigma regulatory factor (Ser/Thr protein kinase)